MHVYIICKRFNIHISCTYIVQLRSSLNPQIVGHAGPVGKPGLSPASSGLPLGGSTIQRSTTLGPLG